MATCSLCSDETKLRHSDITDSDLCPECFDDFHGDSCDFCGSEAVSFDNSGTRYCEACIPAVA